ncbi:MAG: hypothetical protein Q8J89_08935 [Caulobacter sp.]|nr:hypothetical protein [Caulobacter sp.]
MTPFWFDTLGASKQLREAGMPEGMAEAVVSVFQHAAMTPDIAHLATKADLEALKAEMATKADLLELEVRMMERIRQQGWATLGGMTVLLAVSMAIGKLIA